MARQRSHPRPPNAPRRRRRGLKVALVVLVVVLVPVILTRSMIVKAVVLPLIESRLGADVTVSRLVIRADARIIATGVEVRLRGLEGPASRLLTAESVEIVSSWGELLSGSGTFGEVLLVKPRVRVSRDTQSGSINLSELSGSASERSPLVELPRIIVRGGTIELGEHTGAQYDLLRTLRVEGSAQPTAAAEGGGYVLAFAEDTVSDPEGRGLGLTGRVSPNGITLSLDGLEFGQWEPEHIPAQFREVFELMRIEGGIPRVTMSVGADGSASGRIELDGVALNLPFDAEGRQANPANLVRLRDVTGRVELTDAGAEAFLVGMLGDLPSEVWLRYDGLSANAGFRCEIETEGFVLRSDPEIQPLVPKSVVRRLNDFSNPTMTVDASVVVERAPPTGSDPGAIRVFGELAFRDGSASFHNFPYEFGELTGLARFNADRIEIVRVDGVAESGARMHAEGVIAPLSSAAGVDLRITVDDVPIDEATLVALGAKRRAIVESLMSEPAYQGLRERGLVSAPGSGEPGLPFVMGGVGSVVIDVQRAVGEEVVYSNRVRVRLPEIGLVNEWFPLPIVATDVELLIADGEVKIVTGEFASVSGGRVDVDLAVDLTKPGQSGVGLTIRAQAVPTDALLMAALPGGLDEHEGTRSPGAVLRRLGIKGAVDCVVVIGPREGGELGYDIEVDFAGLSAAPIHGPGVTALAVDLEDVRGRLRVSEHELGLAMTSRVRERGSPNAEGEASDQQRFGTLAVDARMQLGGATQPFTAEIEAQVPDVRWALEDLVSLIAPEMADRLGAIRRERQPTGGVRLSAHAAGDAAGEGEVSRVEIQVFGLEELAFDDESGRLTVSSIEGTLGFDALSPEAIEFDGWVAEVRLDDAPACGVELSGRAPIGRAWKVEDVLEVGLRGARLESSLVRQGASRGLPTKLVTAMEATAIEGVFDADLRLRGERGSDHPRVAGEIRPQRCELTLAGQRVSIDSMRGGIVLDETGGTFESCHAEGDGWWAEIGGAWVATGGGSVLFDCELSAMSEFGLVPEVLALMPAGLRGALDAVSIGADGPVAAQGVTFRVSLGEGEGSAYSASGRVVFAGASADIGVKITAATGYLDFEGQSEPGAALGNFGIGVIVDSAQAAGIQLRDGMLRVTSDPRSGAVLVPVILADAYGGRVSGSAIVYDGGDGRSMYDAEFRLSGVPLGELLADWEHAAGIERAAETDEAAPERPNAESRGMVDAGLTLTGVIGDNQARRGRGTILVGGGADAAVLRLPLLLPLIAVSNLQVPTNDPLDFGEAVFFVGGDRVVFERVGVFAKSVEIFGYGQMTLPGLDLDFRFTSRAVDRLPLISDLVEKFRNELITTRVRGTAKDPRVTVEQFARTKRLLAGIVGRELSAEERRMLEIERLSRESERREWRVDRPGGSSSGRGR